MRALLLALLIALSFTLKAFGAVVERIEIYGLKWTKEEFVRRELLIKEGEEFSPELLKLSIRNLLNTHLFYRVKPVVVKRDGRVVVKLYLKEKFPIVPLPRVRLKSDGSYKAGLEVRHYNLLGMGHRLFTGYTRWFNTDEPAKNAFLYLNLYRVVAGRGNLYAGAYYTESSASLIKNGEKVEDYTFKRYSYPLGITLYLDSKKVNQITAGITPTFSINDGELPDSRLYYLNLYYTRDRSTDMVYYTVGRRWQAGISVSSPEVSSVFTGSLTAAFTRSVRRGKLKTQTISVSLGSKVGYSGAGYYLRAPISGYAEERLEGKRYIVLTYSYRFPVVDRSVFLKPAVSVGDAFDSRPDDLLTSVGLELTAFWAKLADGIIRFKVFRGLGALGETKSSFRLSFRW